MTIGDLVKDYVVKPAVALALVGGAAYAVAGDSSKKFDNFGEVDTVTTQYGWPVAITAADFDGDGDQDFAVVDGHGHVILYENTMPQKGKSSPKAAPTIKIPIPKDDGGGLKPGM